MLSRERRRHVGVWIGALTACSIIGTTFALAPVEARPQAPIQVAPDPESPAAATIQTVATASSPAAPGAQATIDLTVLNTGVAAAASPVTVTVSDLPTGATLVGATTSEIDTSWSCSAAPGGGVCTLVANGTSTPVPLEGESSAGGQLTLLLDGTVVVGPGLPVSLAVGVGPATSPTPDLSKAEASVTLAPLGAGASGSLLITDDLPGAMEVATPATGTLRIRNLGPVTIGGGSSPVTVTGLVPPGATGASASGSGWACGGSPLSCTWNGATVGVGAELPELTMDLTSPSAATGATPITYTRIVTATRPGQTSVVGTQAGELVVFGHPTPDVALTAAASGPAGTEAPGTVASALTVSGSSLDDPSVELNVLAVPPAGFTYSSVSSNDGWTCAMGGRGSPALVCRRSGALADDATSTLTVNWAVAAGTAVGSASVPFAAAVRGEAVADQANNQAIVDYTISRPPAASISLRTWNYPGSRPSLAGSGRPLVVTAGVSALIGVDGVNDGSSPIPVGTSLRLVVDLPKGSRVLATSTDQGGPNWACAAATPTGSSVTPMTCTVKLASAVPIGGSIPRIRSRVTVPTTAAVGLAEWPVRLTASVGGATVAALAASTTKAVSVVKAPVLVAKPNVAAEVLVAPRMAGRPGAVRITFGNAGNAPGPAAATLIYLPAGVRALAPLPTGCVASPAYFAPAKVICFTAKGLAPGATSSVTLALAAVSNARWKGVVRMESYVGAPEPVTGQVNLVLLKPLTASATATPTAVTTPAAGEPPVTVLLDGRASSAAEATATWSQVPAAGEPLVVFDGASPGATTVTGLTASFPAPSVTASTTLHLRLTVADGTTTAVSNLTVAVEPPPAVTTGGDTGWGDDVGPLARVVSQAAFAVWSSVDPSTVRPRSTGAATNAVDGWSWSAPPSVQLNDSGAPTAVIGSRARILDNGTYAWTGSGAEPSGISVAQEWLLCDLDWGTDPPTPVNCAPVGTGPVLLVPNNNVQLQLRLTVSGTDASSNPVQSSETFDLGRVDSDYSTPTALSYPSISGAAQVGEVLTLVPGEWTLEFRKDIQWQRCTQDGDSVTCTNITDAINDTYTVGPEDRGSLLRVLVTAFSREGDTSTTEWAQVGPVPGISDCTGDCWRFDAAPTVTPNTLGAGGPIAGYAATIDDDGTATWLDPANPPIGLTTTRSWRECEVASPASCTTATGSQFVPQRVGVTLQAIVTVSASYSVSGDVETEQAIVDLGEVQAPAAAPANLTVPTISGTAAVGETLVADPGTWDYAIRGSGPVGSEYGYRWYRCEAADTGDCVDTGVQSPDYHVTEADQLATAQVLKVAVTAHGLSSATDTTIVTAPTEAVTAAAKIAISPPSVSAGGALMKPGTLLTRVPAVWSAMPASDLSAPEVSWERCTVVPPPSGSGPSTLDCEIIPGATGSTYRLTLDDVGARLHVIERESAGGNETVEASSLNDLPVVQPPDADISASSSLVGDAASIPNSAIFTIVGSGTGEPPLTTGWTQISGPDAIVGTPTDTLQIQAPATGSGDLVFRYDVADSLGRTDFVDVTITYGEVAVPGLVCELLNDITAGGVGPKTFALGSTMTMAFSNATIEGGACGTDTVLRITDATVTLYGWFRIAADEVTVTPDGVTFDGVGLEALNDAALGGVTFQVGADLEIPFTGDLAQLELSGSVLADGIPFVTLPGSWRAAEEITFGSSGGVQTIGFHAVAFEDGAGPPSPLGTQLPTPPNGAATLDVQGSFSSNRTFSLTASGSDLVTFADSGIDFSGSVTRLTPTGGVSFQVLGQLAAPVQLATGMTLKTASLGWNGTTFTGGGSLGLAVNSSELVIGASFAFTNPRNWAATLTVGGPGSWTPASGIVLTNPTVTGTIARTGAVTTASIALEVATVGLGSKARVDALHLAVSATCTAGSSCKPAVALSGTVVAQLQTSTLTVSVAGAIDLAAGTFELTGTVGPFTAMPGVNVAGASLEVRSSGTGVRTVRFSASAVVLGTTAALTIEFDANGSFVSAAVGNWTPFSGAPTFTSAAVVYSSSARSVTVAGAPVPVPANTVYLTAVTVPPQWFRDMVNTNVTTAVVGGSVNLGTSEFDLQIRFALPSSTLVNTGGVKVTLTSVSFRVTSRGGTVSTGLGADARIEVPRMGGGSPVAFDMALSALYDPTSRTLSGSLTKVGDWNDAFGVSGLTVRNLTISIQVRSSGLPNLGFAGSAVLPSGWASNIGLAPGTQVSLVAALGGTSSCFGLQIGNPNSASTVLDIANVGAITARYAAFYFAPTGCTVGPFTVPAGLSLNFDGSVLGTPVRVQATVTPSPFTVDARVTIGDVAVGGFGLRDTTVTVAITPVQQQVTFQATASLYGATATVQGAFTRGPSGAVLDFSGTFAAPDLGGFRLDQLYVAFHFESGPPSVLRATAAANVTILGQPQSVAFDLTLVNGQVTRLHGTAAVSITVGPAAITGTAAVTLVKSQFPTIAITGSLSVSGRSLTAATLLVQPNGVSVTATLDVPGVFTTPPVLSGTIAWNSGTSTTPLPIVDRSGATVDALPGDFRLDARNVTIGTAGFAIDTDVSIGQVRGDFWAEFRSNVRLGVDATNARIDLQGTFSSTGDFSLAGTGAIELAGFPVTGAQFTLARSGGTVSLRVAASVAVPQLTTVSFSGSFSRTAAGTFFELTGTGTVNPGGYNFGTGTFALYRRANPSGGASTQGLAAQVNVNVPGLAAAQATMSITSSGSFNFGVDVGMSGTIGQVLGNPTARATFYSGQSTILSWQFISTPPYVQVVPVTLPRQTYLAFSAQVRNAMKLPGSFTVSGSISSSGAYSLTARVEAGPWSWSLDVGVCTARLSAGGTFSASISGTANALSISVDLDASASAKCGSIGVSAGATVEFDYSPPNSFSGTVKGRIKVKGIGTWHPTLFRL